MKNLFLVLAFLSFGIMGYSQNITIFNNTPINLDIGAQGAKMHPTDCPDYLDNQTGIVGPYSFTTLTFSSPVMTAIRVGASASASYSGYDVFPFWTPSPMCLTSAPGPFTFTWISATQVMIN